MKNINATMQQQLGLINKINKATIEHLNTEEFWQNAFNDLMQGKSTSDFILFLLNFNNDNLIDSPNQKNNAALEGSWRYISEQKSSNDIINAMIKFNNYNSITTQLNKCSKTEQIIKNLEEMLNNCITISPWKEIAKINTALSNVVNQEQEEDRHERMSVMNIPKFKNQKAQQDEQQEEERQGRMSVMNIPKFKNQEAQQELQQQNKPFSRNNYEEEKQQEKLTQNFQNMNLQPKAAKNASYALKDLYKKILDEAKSDYAEENPVLEGIYWEKSNYDHPDKIQLMKQVKEIHNDIEQRIIDARTSFNVSQEQIQNDDKVLNFIISTLYNKVAPELLLEAGYDSKTFQTFLKTHHKIEKQNINKIIEGIDQYTEKLCANILEKDVTKFSVPLLLRAYNFITDETNIVDEKVKKSWKNQDFLDKIMTYFAEVIEQCKNAIADKQNVFLKALAPNEPAVLQSRLNNEAENKFLENATKYIYDIQSFQSFQRKRQADLTNSSEGKSWEEIKYERNLKEKYEEQEKNTQKLSSTINYLYYDLQPQKSLEENMQTLYNNILADETCTFKGVGNSRNYSGDVFENQIRAYKYSDAESARKNKFIHDVLQLMYKIKEFKNDFKGSAEIIENVDKVFDAIFIQFNNKSTVLFAYENYNTRLPVFELSHGTKFAAKLKIKNGRFDHDWFITQDENMQLYNNPGMITDYFNKYPDIGEINFEDAYRDATGKVQDFNQEF